MLPQPEPEQDRFFQIGTFVVLGIALVVCLCYFIIFVNPQIAFNPARPPTATIRAAQLPATFTPLPTRTTTPTQTPEPTQPATNTPLPTDTPKVFLPTPTRLIAPTQRPPGFTPRPLPTNTRPPPTATISPYTYTRYQQDCTHSGGTYIDVYAFVSNTSEPVSGVLVVGAVGSPSGPRLSDQPLQTGGNGRVTFVLAGDGQPARVGTYYVALVSSSGAQISPIAQVNITGGPPDVAGTCWYARVGFFQR